MAVVIDVAIPSDDNIRGQEHKELEKHQRVKELKRMQCGKPKN